MNFSFKLATQNSLRHPSLYALIALFIVPLSGLNVDIFVPSLPALTHYFDVSKSSTQLSITMYLLGIGVTQLFSGAISDSFGRKAPFLFGMLLNIAVTFLIPFSQTINELLFLRILQGVFVGIFIVPIRSTFSDLFTGVTLHKMLTYATVAWSIGPVVAPAIGGYLQHYLGWQWNFYFLGIYSFLGLLLMIFFVPETSAYRHPFKIKTLLKNYKEILFHREYVLRLLTNCSLYSILLIFAVVGSFLIQQELHYTAVKFGHMALLVGLAWFSGAMTNRFLIHIQSDFKVKTCLWVMLLIAVISVMIVLALPLNIYLVIIPAALLIYFGGIIFPNNFATALGLFPKTSGSANSLFAAFVFLIPGINSALATFLKADTAVPLTLAYMALVIISMIIFYIYLLRKSHP
jgi:Bcr/CflA subfamily drug resistance transporter